MNQLLLYGAVTPPRIARSKNNLKTTARLTIDRIKAATGSLAHLDYRNYIDEESFNRGDLAISIATQYLIKKANKDTSTCFADWKSLPQHLSNTSTLICGGGYFYIENNGRLAKRILDDHAILKKENALYGIFGAGVNKISISDKHQSEIAIHAEDREYIASFLDGAKFVAVRDEHSRELLQPLTRHCIFVCGDPALHLGSPHQRQANTSIGMPAQIGINIPFHGPAANERIMKYLSNYVELFKSIQRNTACEMIYMPHFDSEVLIANLLKDAGIKLSISGSSLPELLSTYSKLDLHIGGMLHSCILACSVGTPSVGLAYDIKHNGFFSTLQIPELCIEAHPIDIARTTQVCINALNERSILRTKIEAVQAKLFNDSIGFLQKNMHLLECT